MDVTDGRRNRVGNLLVLLVIPACFCLTLRMPLSTPTRCGFCHQSQRHPDCKQPIHPDALCEASGPTHHAYATRIVEWVEVSAHGDESRMAILTCGHAACEGNADTFAHLTGRGVEVRDLTVEDVAEHLGLDLTEVAA